MEKVWTELAERIVTRQPVPEPAVVSVLAAIAVLTIVLFWPQSRMFVTIIHEAGHAVMATVTGRKLTGIRLHSDTSGLTVSRGRPTGIGMVLTLLAGYLAPGLFGLAAALMLASGRAVAMLWALVALFALMLVKIRNFYGLLVLVAVVAALATASWYLPPVYLSWLGYLITWFWLLAAPRPVLELGVRKTRGSDAAQLARITAVPAPVWSVVFGVGTLACLVGGVAVLMPQLLG